MTATILPFLPPSPAEPFAAEFLAMMEAVDTGRPPAPIGDVIDLAVRRNQGRIPGDPACPPTDQSRSA
jgi:hypothetical protein